mmetsp:Transcript_13435/g.29130  ORF Transcript_13435/g.29130 Transcript_13435/m.29130 type:complete len:208 (-) Transcript_13435:164-787(-)
MIPSAQVTGIDPSPNMLALAKTKVAEAELSQRIELKLGESETLTFEDDTFDAIFVSFGVRNFADRERGLRELSRVLKTEPHAVVAILEVSDPPASSPLAPIARLFTRTIVPFLASVVSGRPDEYVYLQESMESFPDSDTFASMLELNGFELISHQRLAPFGLGPNLFVARCGSRSSKPAGEESGENKDKDKNDGAESTSTREEKTEI